VTRSRLIVALAGLSLSGCLTFYGGELPFQQLPAPGNLRPLISTEVGNIELLHNGRPDRRVPPTRTTTSDYGESALVTVLDRWVAAGLIAGYGRPSKLPREPDYQLRISGTQSEDSSLAAAIVSSVTLYLYPVSQKIDSDWTFHLTNARTHQEFEVHARTSITIWTELVFLPLFPFSIGGEHKRNTALASYVYDELEFQGAWQRGAGVEPASSHEERR
jgi:hypothetical protein